MRKAAPINVIVHYPTTEEGWCELRRRVAIVHADAVLSYIQKLNLSDRQRVKLIDKIIEEVNAQIVREREAKGE